MVCSRHHLLPAPKHFSMHGTRVGLVYSFNMLRTSWLAATMLLWLGCAKTPRAQLPAPVPSPDEIGDAVETLSERAEALVRKQDLLLWQLWTEGKVPDIARTYEGTDTLFTLANIRTLTAARAYARRGVSMSVGAPPSPGLLDVRALEALQTYFVGEYLSLHLAEQNDAVANLETSMQFGESGAEHACRDLTRLLTKEPSAPARRALYRAATPCAARLTAALARREERQRALLQDAGYPTVDAYVEQLRALSVDGLAQIADSVLESTQTLYLRLLAELARKELGLRKEQLRVADLPRLFKPPSADSLFPKDTQVRRARALAAGLGTPLESLSNITVDGRDAAKKNPRPLSIPIRVPEDVRLSIRPVAGLAEQAHVFEAVGHALHAGHTGTRRFELARLGSPILARATGQLFSELVTDPQWLQETAAASRDVAASLARAGAAQALFEARRAAGHFLYSVLLHRLPTLEEKEAKPLYRSVMARTYGFELDEDEAARYLVDVEEFHGAADTLRAALLSAQLSRQLMRTSHPFWKNDASKQLLVALWNTGTSFTADEIAHVVQAPGLDAAAWVEQIHAKIQGTGLASSELAP
jgi:hypothetical protein